MQMNAVLMIRRYISSANLTAEQATLMVDNQCKEEFARLVRANYPEDIAMDIVQKFRARILA